MKPDSLNTQTTNDLLREILAAVKDLSLSLRTSEGTSDNISVIESFGDVIPVRNPLRVQKVLSERTDIAESLGSGDGVRKKDESESEKLCDEVREKISRDNLTRHRLKCVEMEMELDHLISHYWRVGGDEVVMESARLLKSQLMKPLKSLEKALTATEEEWQIGVNEAYHSIWFLSSVVTKFHNSLYHQKHAFYFREVRQWSECLNKGCDKAMALRIPDNWYDHPDSFLFKCLEYMCNELISEMDLVMHRVIPELRTFGERHLSNFLANEQERATTRYVNITTIATFFSSVTATTLQFSFTQSGSVLGGVVNLFWFLSLVFSVSSGVSSLLGMTWRKSSIYHVRLPPKLIRLWLDKAPIIFLIIAAVAFIIGLNLFAYLSLQPKYVSLATNIFTSLHGTCLLAVTTWFIYALKYHSFWAAWIRRVREQIRWRFGNRRVRNLLLRRSIFWALGMDNHVASLNTAVYWDTAGPHLLSRFIRRIVYPIKWSWMRIWKRKHLRTDSEARTDIIQGATEPPQGAEPSSDQAEAAKNQYRTSLEWVFGKGDFVNELMQSIDLWMDGKPYVHDDQWLDHELNKLLWGYPKLKEEFYREVQPELFPEKTRRRQMRPRVDSPTRVSDMLQQAPSMRSLRPISSDPEDPDNIARGSDDHHGMSSVELPSRPGVVTDPGTNRSSREDLSMTASSHETPGSVSLQARSVTLTPYVESTSGDLRAAGLSSNDLDLGQTGSSESRQ